MYFENIRPFVRYARYLCLNQHFGYPEYLPLDNRIFYTTDGEGIIHTPSGDYHMTPGSILVIHAGCNYELKPGNVTYLVLNFDYTDTGRDKIIPIPPVSVTDNRTFPDCTENVQFEDFPALNTYCYIEKTFSVKNLLTGILSEYNERLRYSEMNTSSLLTSVLIRLYRTANNRVFGTNLVTINDIAAYIHQHYNKPITNDELAEMYNFHPNYLSSLFKKNFGKSLHQYLLDIRISNAITLLEEGNMSISEIASETGFSDKNYFSRYFRKVTGISPKYYKR